MLKWALSTYDKTCLLINQCGLYTSYVSFTVSPGCITFSCAGFNLVVLYRARHAGVKPGAIGWAMQPGVQEAAP